MIFAIITIYIFSIVPTCIAWGIVRLLKDKLKNLVHTAKQKMDWILKGVPSVEKN